MIDFEKLKNIKASDLMSSFGITVYEHDLLSQAAHLMMRFKISGMPVLSKDNQIVGIITSTDLMRLMGECVRDKDGSLKAAKIGEQMSRSVHTIQEDTPLNKIIQLMTEKNIHTIPVVENHVIVGIIGRRDVLNAFYSLLP